MFSKKNYLFYIILFLFFNSSTNVRALTISISNLPSTINFNQESEVDLLFTCSSCGDYSYMRGVFYPSGTNYFGFTQNNLGSWVGTVADRSLYYQIAKTDLIESTWSGKLKIKPDYEDTAFSGTGEYLFKVGRYTSSGDSSAEWSNELLVKIIGPSPSPTLVPTQEPTTEPTKTPSPAPVITPTPKPTPTKTATSKPTSTSTPTETPDELANTKPPILMGLNGSTSTPESLVAGASTTKKSPIFPIILVALGLLLMTFGGINLYKKMKTEYNSKNESS